MKSGPRTWDVLVLILFVTVLQGWRIGATPLANTEGHRALTGHQMVQSGQYLVPRLYGYTYLTKPPMVYWMIAGAEKLTGIASETVWRSPAVVCAVLLVMLIYIESARWFGRPTGLGAGFCCAGLIAIWQTLRSADIDAPNILFSVLTALALLELNHRNGKWGWTLIGGVGCGLMLLTKLHAGLPVVMGALLGPSVIQRRWAWVKRPYVWTLFGIGLLMFLAWAIPVYLEVRAGRAVFDRSGLTEAAGHARLWRNGLDTIATPFLLMLFSLPMSLGVVLAFHKPLVPRESGAFVITLAAAVIGGLAVSLLAGIHNPRYAYMVLPMVCPLAAEVGRRWFVAVGPSARSRYAPAAMGLILALATAGVSLRAWQASDRQGWIILANISAVLLVLLAVICGRKGRLMLAGLMLPVLLLAFNVAFQEDAIVHRTQKSGKLGADKLRAAIGESGAVYGADAIWAQPELFYYAGVDIRGIDRARFGPANMPWSGTVVLTSEELQRWRDQAPGRLINIHTIIVNRTAHHVALVRAAWR